MPRAVVITVSDRAAAGSRDDAAGPRAVAALGAAGYECSAARVIADGDASVERELRAVLEGDAPDLIVTTGGTGVGPRDRTPEGTRRVIELALPGIAEELRRSGQRETPTAVLSRGIAGTIGTTLIVNLPGSPRAVDTGISVVLAVAAHVHSQLGGGDHT